MNTNNASSFGSFGTARLTPALAGRAHDLSRQDWQRVHAQLLAEPATQQELLSLPAVGALALYHHCVAKALGGSADATRAQQWRAHLAARLLPLPARPWSLVYLDQACLLAWLASQESGYSPSLLAMLDDELARESQRLLADCDALSRPLFFQALRYFSLRLPDPNVLSLLRTTLAAWPGALGQAPSHLGLAGGFASELLICIRLAKAGVTTLGSHVREGVRYLLTTKRPVDSGEQHYAIFPNEISPLGAKFSAELSWQRGDLGQALLLYEAHSLLRDPELVKFADLVGLHTLLRTTLPTTEVRGVSLYRGTAGVTHLYRQLHNQHAQPAYQKGYEFWLALVRQWLPAECATPAAADALADPLRHGLVGTALVLLSASTEQELGWEDALLGAA